MNASPSDLERPADTLDSTSDDNSQERGTGGDVSQNFSTLPFSKFAELRKSKLHIEAMKCRKLQDGCLTRGSDR